MRTRKIHLLRTCVLAPLFIAATLVANGATVAPVTVEKMLIESKLVIDGTVLDVVTQKSPDSDAIYTVVTFQVYEVIKGSTTDRILQVRFLGGIADGVGMHIPGLIYPEYGERGIYFLEDPSRHQINPIFGWDQGHFIVDDPGAGDDAKIYTIGFGPIYGIDRQNAAETLRVGSKTAIGIQTHPPEINSTPMTIGEFKSALRQTIAEIATQPDASQPN